MHERNTTKKKKKNKKHLVNKVNVNPTHSSEKNQEDLPLTLASIWQQDPSYYTDQIC